MPKVGSLSIAGYKSIRRLEDFKLSNLNVLIGANGAGKSNFISLFRLLNEMYEQNLQVYVQQREGGPDAVLHFGRKITERLHAEFYFGHNGYKFDLVPTSDNRLIFEREISWFSGDYKPSHDELLGQGHEEARIRTAKDRISSYVRPALQSWRIYHFHDTSNTAKVKQRHAANDNLRLKADAANLAAYLRMLRSEHEESYHRIVETIQLVAPFFGDFIERPGNPETIELEWTQKGYPDTPFKAHMLSDGTLRFICLATLLLQPSGLLPDTVLIDEPELGLHPYAISVLADIFKQVSERKQLIVSTQSVELVNELSPEDVIVVDQQSGYSTFQRFTEEQLEGWLTEYSMGELWKRNVLGGRP
ncbi:AAA family ATPase [Dyella nitratireducens]|uniref:Chromosome segregation protein SMC n=1 Tax=Dyella nitratireducens TaxID=1849580 RepID=A0ABQ1GL68_9GAMM|nr:AAA family ATPase [Dyella nitratireducens]GGA46032.1 chromosome segregation protein SMC [Dyella nitratireducens]GLQ41397.1 chromosome segregation protein SMC [Dyella nitratireducens]